MAPLSTNAVQHFLHPAHKLTELIQDTPYLCDGCKIAGNGTRFSCASCQFDLHVYCAKCPTRLTSTTSHPHPMSLVVYKPKPDQTEACQTCLEPIQGLVYECKSCSFLVHPLCVLRNNSRQINQGSAKPSSTSAAQRIGENIVGGVAGKIVYDTFANDSKQEVPIATADPNALGGIPEIPTADPTALGGIPEESGSWMMSLIESVFSSSSS